MPNRKGNKHSDETKQKMSEKKKGKNNPNYGKDPWNKGLKTNIKPWEGKKRSGETKKKISKRLKGRRLTEEHKRNIIENNCKYWLGKERSEETKNKLSKSARERRIKEILEQGYRLQMGKNEKKILDEMEKNIGYKILRQYNIIGYILDGYCKENNTVYEVDEDFHFDPEGNLSKKDLKRQKDIEEELNCKFVRIRDKGD